MHCKKISTEFEFGGHRIAPLGVPQNVALGYDVGKISEGCLVTIIIIIIIICKVTATENNHTTKQHKTKWQHKL